ncbi:capsule biosynthesis protein [Rhodalgimonas zhirmunskyi]|uniref:Capsule biosynthesis protein n=1 Tax=Rhodalgimonas zhirmunskyi TaxID=2964767 RepID=A0AAJ1U719_9RHOB|nr:capsule biosynthesis protein [Rhodoalgimonas zhirmunskyi]MDQ2094651.1 capsule biosynthesis protein [Rhodoalgimonas zhirmunskyi]
MTTKPKARKFRIRRSPGTPGSPAGVGERPRPKTVSQEARPPSEPANTAPRAPIQPVQPAQPQQSPAQAAAKAPTKSPAASPAPQGARPPAEPPQADASPAQKSAPQPTPQPQAQPHPQATPPQADIASARETRAETDIDAIRREGLTGRQLRMARRVAQKHGLAPISDFDAVRQLRQRGIDPFKRSNMLELVVQGKDDPATQTGSGGGNKGTSVPSFPVDDGGDPPDMGRVQLPQTVRAGQTNLPSTDTMSPADRRAAEIMEIQRDIARRRRRRLGLLLTRLSAFVFLPTILAGWYYFALATPMYATNTEFLILKADGAGSAMSGLLPSQYATSQDAIAVQSYLQSKDAMRRLDEEQGFKAHFSQDWIDPIQRLPDDASNEVAYKLYKKDVKIGYDPTEGVIRMEVVAAEPEVAFRFASSLISYAEERVDALSRKKREDSMASAKENLERAKTERRAAQEALVNMQETEGVDPTEQLGAIRSQITNYETQLQEKELQLAALLDNARPNQAKVDGARGDVRRLKELLAKLNAKMSEATQGQDSLAARSARIQMAQADLATADLFLQNALQAEKQTALEANKQVRYLTVPVRPVMAEDPSYPRAFENTILAFLIFAGIYLMISLTSSILREQVSS